MKKATIDYLQGKIIDKIEKDEFDIIFSLSNGEKLKMTHLQDCCENVSIDDVNGDLEDLIGTPILKAEEVSNYIPSSESEVIKQKEAERWGHCTWTFYKLATIKGYVDIRWFGESNGYYSEGVDLIIMQK